MPVGNTDSTTVIRDFSRQFLRGWTGSDADYDVLAFVEPRIRQFQLQQNAANHNHPATANHGQPGICYKEHQRQ